MPHHRRQFLAELGSAAGYLLAASAKTRGNSPNDSLGVACIGTGVRGKTLLQALAKLDGVRVVAVCDVWDANLASGKEAAGSSAVAVKDYRRVLDRTDVDAVIIATPDHNHSPITIAACKAGKDVYVEKPLTHAIHEAQPMLAARDAHRRIIQVGTQQRSMPQFQQARELVRSGLLGRVHKVHLTWNRNYPRWERRDKFDVDPSSVDWQLFLGNAPPQPFDDYRMLSWRSIWDFGGGILCDLMVHHLDIVNWYLDLDQPSTVMTLGNNFMSKGIWETPDTVQTLLEYSERGLQVHFEGTYANARSGSSIEIMGTEATLYLDRGRFELIAERGKPVKAQELVLGDGPKGKDFYKEPYGELLHLLNWLECIRSRRQPIAPLEAGICAASAAHMANQSLREGRLIVAS